MGGRGGAGGWRGGKVGSSSKRTEGSFGKQKTALFNVYKTTAQSFKQNQKLSFKDDKTYKKAIEKFVKDTDIKFANMVSSERDYRYITSLVNKNLKTSKSLYTSKNASKEQQGNVYYKQLMAKKMRDSWRQERKALQNVDTATSQSYTKVSKKSEGGKPVKNTKTKSTKQTKTKTTKTKKK